MCSFTVVKNKSFQFDQCSFISSEKAISKGTRVRDSRRSSKFPFLKLKSYILVSLLFLLFEIFVGFQTPQRNGLREIYLHVIEKLERLR